MAAFLDFLFARKHRDPPPTAQPDKTITTSIRLVESKFDPDGGETDLMWYGYMLRDDRDIALRYDEVSERVHYSVRVFKVAGTSHRPDALQDSAFEPGKMLMLKLENDNHYDANAISVWDEQGRVIVGYVPREINQVVRAILQASPESKAMSLAQSRKSGRRVGLEVLFGPIVCQTS